MSTLETVKHLKNLEETQLSFYQSLFEKNISDQHYDFISSSFPNERLNIYKQTILENIRNTLQITFPGIWALLGEECASSVAYAFCFSGNNLPSTGCLDDFGEDFPDYLSTLEPLSGLPYLKDYTLYEWLKHKACCAANTEYIMPEDLQAVPENKIEEIKFLFNPAVFTFSSLFPIQEIHHIILNPDAPPINLEPEVINPIYGVITRLNNEIMTIWVSADIWHFVSYLKQNNTLAQSINKTQEIYPEIDLTKAICFLLKNQLVSKIILP